MTHPHYHAVSSAKLFGGKPEDYIAIHNWLDDTKESFADFRHRAMRHHAEGIFECERVFGVTLTNSDHKQVPVRYVAEQHVMEDCGRIPSLADWLSKIQPEVWMARASKVGAHNTRRAA